MTPLVYRMLEGFTYKIGEVILVETKKGTTLFEK